MCCNFLHVVYFGGNCIEQMAELDYEGVRLTARFFREEYDLGLANPDYISLVIIYNELS